MLIATFSAYAQIIGIGMATVVTAVCILFRIYGVKIVPWICLFLTVFFVATVISEYLLASGFLR